MTLDVTRRHSAAPYLYVFLLVNVCQLAFTSDRLWPQICGIFLHFFPIYIFEPLRVQWSFRFLTESKSYETSAASISLRMARLRHGAETQSNMLADHQPLFDTVLTHWSARVRWHTFDHASDTLRKIAPERFLTIYGYNSSEIVVHILPYEI